MRPFFPNRRAALFAALLLGACATPVEVRYYALSSGSPPPAATATAEYRLAIGPASVPEAIDRQQLVLRDGENRYRVADGDQWSEPLKRAIPRVLAENIGRRLPAARVAAHNQYGGSGSDYQVLLDVLRMDSVPGVSTRLQVKWRIRSRAGEIVGEGAADLAERPDDPGLDALVLAYGRSLDRLASQISASLSPLRDRPGPVQPKRSVE